MAGMLPGVEAARRRRVHQSNGPPHGLGSGSSPSSRRCSFSLFSTNSSASPLGQQRIRTCQGEGDDEKLGQLAREAKERLDERLLKAQTKSLTTTRNKEVGVENNVGELRREVYGGGGSKKKKKKKKQQQLEEEEECAVCLDEFKVGDNLVNMPCSHRFHSTCLIPWLQTNTNPPCPCCRMPLLSSSFS